MYKRNIQRLTQTYLTLSLEDIANTVHLNSAKEAEMHVLQMVVLIIILIFLLHFHTASKFTFNNIFLVYTYSWSTDSGWWDICNNQPEGWNGEILRGSWAIQNLWNDWAYRFINPEVWFWFVQTKLTMFNAFPVLPTWYDNQQVSPESSNENMWPNKFLINYFMVT